MLLACSLHAAEQHEPDPDLPQPFSFDSKALETFRSHSPFNRVVSLQDTYKLTGVAYIDGKPMATLMDKNTKQHFVVSEKPNAMGWTLTGATLSDEPDKTVVHVMIGSEEVVMHYSEAEAMLAAAKNARGDSSSGKRLNIASSSSTAQASGVDPAALLGDRGQELLNALSPENRDKLTSIMAASAAKHPERTKEQLAATAQKIYEKMRASETKPPKASNNSAPKLPKALKPKKQ